MAGHAFRYDYMAFITEVLVYATILLFLPLVFRISKTLGHFAMT
jgi:hypothetical protein